jgi:hypothetical protein
MIPEEIRLSEVLTGNDLGKLGNVEAIPSKEEIEDFKKSIEIQTIMKEFPEKSPAQTQALHLLAHQFLQQNQVMDAWKTLLQNSI